MHRRAPHEPVTVARDEVGVGNGPKLVEHLTAPILEWARRDGAERRLVDARRRVELVHALQRLIAMSRDQRGERLDANAARRDHLLRRRELQRRGRERDDLLVRADDLDEAATDDEFAARGAVVGPKARDLGGAFVELGAKLVPDRGADSLPTEPRVDGQPDEVPARIETAWLVIDLPVSEWRVLLVRGDDAHALVPPVVPAAILLAGDGNRDVALLGETFDPDEGWVVALREEPDPRRHTRRPGSTPDSHRYRSVASSSPIVVAAP